MSENMENSSRTGNEIAVIGVSGRFPGAAAIDIFWDNLKNGVESLTYFSDEELEEAGVNAEIIKNPGYVKVRGILGDIDYFDSSFFDYTPADAAIMDPQMRILHECAWEALEDAGYTPGAYEGFIGLYAGASSSFNWKALTMLKDTAGVLDAFSAMQLNDKDFMTTRVSYKLDLKGPSFTMYTACSTSLVSVVLACQGLLGGECDMALAGGVTAVVPQDQGYLYRDGMIASPDGHCRAFDENAGGTTFGNGAGIVLLKLLEEAVEDGDNIYAVVRGAAVNNDGARKAGYTAPSIDGQAEVIKAAMEMAEIEPETIRYIETHGTGTALGDPVEIEALKMAFDTTHTGFCPIGSVKTNMGHLDSAAGIAGFIKTVLVLKHRLIPPSLHFQKGNPRIDFENSPFYVNTRLTPPGESPCPFRAGVSAFGIGGTNAHVVLEEWTGDGVGETGAGGQQLILLSAKTETALEKMTENLAAHLEKNPRINLADVAYTLQVGRRSFGHRRMLTASTVDGALEVLSSPESGDLQGAVLDEKTGDEPFVVFMFSGQGAQYVNMCLGLYDTEPVFRDEADRCFSLLQYDLKEIVFNKSYRSYKTHVSYSEELNRTGITQPALFIFEYALARLLTSWGIKPHAMIGHSIGEYVAAHLAGVFSLEDALSIVTLRGKSMQRMPSGAMLSVSLSEEQLTPLLNGKLSLAAVNSSALCTVSGPHEAVLAFEKELIEAGHRCRRLHTSHAFHSGMMTPMLSEFETFLRGIDFKAPQIPYISNLTGKWISAEQAVDPGYWAAHVRRTVRFGDGLGVLMEKENALFLEVGPGKSLCTFVRDHAGKKRGHRALNLVRHPSEEVSDTRHLLGQIGRFWLSGAAVDWTAFHGGEGEKRKRVSLPVYPFERRFYPVGGNPYLMAAKMMNERAGAALPADKRADMADWFYVPLWEQTMAPRHEPGENGENRENHEPVNRLIFSPKEGPGHRPAEALAKSGPQGNVAVVVPGPRFGYSRETGFTIRPSHAEDYDALFHKLREMDLFPHKILHLWGVTGEAEKPSVETVDRELDLGFYSLLHIVQAVGRMGIMDRIELNAVTDNMQKVTGDERLCPPKATVLGAVKVIPLEHPTISCRSIDIVLPEPGSPQEDRLFAQLAAEFRTRSPGGTEIAAYRGAHRWVPVIRPHKIDPPGGRGNAAAPLKQEGVYLVTGGLGGMGLTLAEYLAKHFKARLILIGRSAFPPREEWDRWLEGHDRDEPVGRKIVKIREMERAGAEVIIAAADVADPGQMSEVVSRARERFGPVNGVLHTAGVADYEGMILRRTREMNEGVMAAKVRGTLVLDRIFKDTSLDFFVLFSSIGNVAYKIKFGQVGYNAANEFLEAFARYDNTVNGKSTFAINWNDWLEVGMSIDAVNRQVTDRQENIDYETLLHNALTPPQGVEVFLRILGAGPVNVTVSVYDLVKTVQWLEDNWGREFPESSPGENNDGPRAPHQNRPDVNTPYTAPREKTEQQLAQVWQDFFGYESIGINDDFFEIGGDSLKATVLLARVHKQLDVKIPINEIFLRPTIRKLAEYIDGAEKTVHSSIEPAEKREYYVLSSAQKRLYILHRMNPDSTVYNETSFIPLNAEYDKQELEEVVRLLLKRHESLRTSFLLVNDEPVQKIHPLDEVELKIEYFDMRDETGNGEGSSSVLGRFVRPFDLSTAPLARLGLLKQRSGEEILLIDMHHIVTDVVSKNVFIEDIRAFMEGKELPALRLQYKDFSQWQNSSQHKEEIAKMEAYWMTCFEGDPPQLKLPLDFKRTGRAGTMGYVGSMLPGPVSGKLITLSKERDVTLFMVFLAVYYVFLSRITGVEDIVVGTVTAGRGHADLDRIIGMFVNTLVIRGYPGEKLTFNQFLEDVKTRTLGAFENQDYPLEDLVERLVKTREPGRNPLFDVVFSYDKVEKGDPEEMPFTGEVQAGVSNNPAKFDIIFNVMEFKNSLSIQFNYNTGLFKEETVKRFFHYLDHICAVVSENPDIVLNDIVISHELTAATAAVIEAEEGDFGF